METCGILCGILLLCTLTAALSDVSCGETACPPGHTCLRRTKIPRCIRPDVAICTASGDPHFWTLDNKYYNFMGTCTYTFADVCRDVEADLPTFTVLYKADNRGNSRVSSVCQVTLQTGGHTIVIKKGEVGFVTVDDFPRQLPVSLLGGRLMISHSGNAAFVQLGDDMKLSYDWHHDLWMELTRLYAGKMCGMCGNYNQNADDDFTTPSGALATDADAFGASWMAVNDARCHHGCTDSCPSTRSSRRVNTDEEYMTNNYCGLIKNTEGPFSACHSVIDPEVYTESCLYDVKESKGYRVLACELVTAYAIACQRAGVRIGEWRERAECPLPCPEHSTYNPCGGALRTSCYLSERLPTYPEPCVETCECHEGFVLSQGKCIPKTSCGCQYNGFTYSPNEEFWDDTRCQRRCVCNPKTQQVECKTSPCHVGEECAVKDGIRDCYPTSHGVCTCYTDPHCITPDKYYFSFQQPGVYLLVGLQSLDPTLTDFQVSILTEYRGNVGVTYVGAVYVNAYNMNIEVHRAFPNKVIVNNFLKNLPYNSLDGHLSAYLGPSSVVLEFSMGVMVTYDYNRIVTATLPNRYTNAVWGLCGNYNNDPKDDMTPKGGSEVTDVTTFVKSWQIKEGPKTRDDAVCKDLASEEKRQREGAIECGVMVNKEGPFRNCHGLVDPEPYFSSCIYDSCILERRQSIVCAVIKAYMVACQVKGITVEPWRLEDFCALSCPAHSSYEVCADPCPVTCNGLSAPNGCRGNCTEGCVCNDGYVLSGKVCIPISECGCSHQGSYYAVGESFYAEDTCSIKCTCTLGGNMACVPAPCSANEKCSVENSVFGCHPIGSAICYATGYSNYRSFDGYSFIFQGQCSYILAQTCGEIVSKNDKQQNEFRVTLQKQGSSAGVIGAVIVECSGFNVTLISQQRDFIQINGTITRLPATLQDGKVRVEYSGKHILVRCDHGLEVKFDLKSYVTVKVPGNYKNAVCGLCGNYDGNVEDDEEAIRDPAEFGEKWKAPGETEGKCGGCGGKFGTCYACPGDKWEEYSQSCAIISDRAGPFSKCHQVVDSRYYVQMCISDLCQGGSDVLCDSVYVYAEACRDAGVSDITWRTDAFCPMKCGANSHYSISADTCTTTCAAMTDTFQCSGKSDEGCECDDGYFLDGTDCLPLRECGCYDNGVYHKAKESWWSEYCSQMCSCHPVSGVSCISLICSRGNWCMLRNGAWGCYSSFIDSP